MDTITYNTTSYYHGATALRHTMTVIKPPKQTVFRRLKHFVCGKATTLKNEDTVVKATSVDWSDEPLVSDLYARLRSINMEELESSLSNITLKRTIELLSIVDFPSLSPSIKQLTNLIDEDTLMSILTLLETYLSEEQTSNFTLHDLYKLVVRIQNGKATKDNYSSLVEELWRKAGFESMRTKDDPHRYVIVGLNLVGLEDMM